MRDPGRHKVWTSETTTWDSYLRNWSRNSHHQSVGQTTMKYIWQVRLQLGAVPQISLCHFTRHISQTLPPSTGMMTSFVGIKLVGTIAALSLNPKITLEILRQVDFWWCFSSDALQCPGAYKTPRSWARGALIQPRPNSACYVENCWTQR